MWGGLKTFLYPPKLLVCGGGLKTETAKLHEILTSECGGWGLKTETGKLHEILTSECGGV